MTINTTTNEEDKKVTKNILMVALSNIFTILAGVLTGFVIPKILGVTNNGYYKIFTLYMGYVGLFQFGLLDGIYLYFAGKTYDKLDKNIFRFFTKFLYIFQSIILVLITGVAIFFVDQPYGFVFTFVGIGLLINNINGYYQFVSQITYRFKELAIRNTLKAFLNSLSVVVLFLLYKFTDIGYISYMVYIPIYTLINLLLVLWYVYTYRDITFGKENLEKSKKKELIIQMFKLGIPLLLANLSASLVLTIDNQFVSLLFDTDTYSIYAFAYSMLNIITTAISAISTVLYPSLKTKTEEELKASYSRLNGIILLIVSICMLAYFPLVLIVNWLLPEYSGSLPIFQVIMPQLLFNTAISIVISNYYRTLGLINKYFIKTLIVLALSAIANGIAYAIFKTPISISAASVVVAVVWYIMMESTLIKRWHISFKRNFIYILLILTSFYLTTYLIGNIYIAGFSYLACLIVLILLLERHNFVALIKRNIF